MDAIKTGKLIWELRTERGLTQQELASLLNVSPTTVSKWENGRGLPDISMLEPLAKTLDVPIYEIVAGEKTARGETEMKADAKREEDRTDTVIKSVITESIIQKKKSGRRLIFAVIGIAIVLCLARLFVLPLFGREGQYYDSSKSAQRYTIVADWAAKPAEHLYVYAVDLPGIQEELLERYRDPAKLAAVLPVHTPEHPQYRGEGKNSYFLCLIRAHRSEISGGVYVYPTKRSAEKHDISGLYEDIDWKGIAGYTSPEMPLYLYKEGIWYFGIIGDRAYCLTLRGSYTSSIGVNPKTDNFVPYPGGAVMEIPVNKPSE